MESNIQKSTPTLIYCPICFKNFSNEVKIITLCCGHYFCEACLSNAKFNFSDVCCVCRAINKVYDKKNSYIINLFHSIIQKENEDLLINKYCIECKTIVNEKHQSEFPSHSLLDKNEVKLKLNKIESSISELQKSTYNINKNEDISIIAEEDSSNNIDYNFKLQEKVNSILSSQNLKSKLENLLKSKLKNQNDLGKSNIVSCSIHDQLENKKKNIKAIDNFKRTLKLFKNKAFQKDTYKVIFNKLSLAALSIEHNKNHKSFLEPNYEFIKQYLISYYLNSKQVVIFDVDALESNLVNIKELPFNFDSSQSVEYDHANKRIFIIGGKQENFSSLNSGNILEYRIENSKLSQIQNLNCKITGHKSIIINDYLLVIGGKEGISSFRDIYFNCIHRMDINSYIFEESINLKYARSNFGLSYDKTKLYISFGISSKGLYLNNIEIINLYNSYFLSTIVDLTSCNLNLKDAGSIVDYENNYLLILGGTTEDQQPNSKIYTIDSKTYDLISVNEYRPIVSGTFLSYGTKINKISSLFSVQTKMENIPHVYLFSDMNKKWACHSIDIYN